MKKLWIIPLLISAALAASCNLEASTASSDLAALEAKAAAAAPAAAATTNSSSSSSTPKSTSSSSSSSGGSSSSSSGSGSGPSGGFVWKPISESNGKLAVILPASYVNVTSIRISGARSESSSRSAIANGGRPHFRFSMPGAAYGKNITVSGGGRTWRIADGSKRVEL